MLVQGHRTVTGTLPLPPESGAVAVLRPVSVLASPPRRGGLARDFREGLFLRLGVRFLPGPQAGRRADSDSEWKADWLRVIPICDWQATASGVL